MNDRSGGSGPELPDFSGGGSSGSQLPDFAGGGRGGQSGSDSGGGGVGSGGGHPVGGHSPGASGGPGGSGGGAGGGKGPLLAILLGGVGFVVVVIAILALVLSQTVFKTDPEDPTAGEETGSSEAEDPEQTRPPEYVPTEETTDEAGEAQTTFAEQPTVDCTVHDNTSETEQVDGTVRGGGLEFPVQEGWGVGNNWGSQGSYMVDQHFVDQPVEDGWYTVVGVGKVEFPEEEGGYPGAQDTARAIFQCGLSRDQVADVYGSPPELTDYRDEAYTVDGHDAWIISADITISDRALLDTTDAWRIVVIVVDTPNGPAAFDGGAAIGHDQQVADFETMVEELRVL